MRRLSITWKIWLSIGIFVLGFISSTALVQVQGISREKTLQLTSEALFPAALKSQEAEASFHSAIRAFKDAVVMQDASGLERASQLGTQVVNDLRSITSLSKLPPSRLHSVEVLVPRVESFMLEAEKLYAQVVKTPQSIPSSAQRQMLTVAQQTTQLGNELALTRTQASGDLQHQLTQMRSQSQHQRWFALLVFGITVVIAAVMVNLTIHWSVMTPLLRINSQLNEARQKAEEANHSKGQFLANMSHELRTPMNGILGMTQLVLDTELTQDQRECLSMAKGSAEVLLGLLNEILDLSKIEAGKLNLESLEFPLRDTLADALRFVAIPAFAKGLRIAYTADPEIADTLVGDPGRLRQVVINLVGNAIKFTSQGEIVLTVRLESQWSQGCRLRFSVRDTGIGIAPENQGRIFDAFAQADGSSTRRYGGTGLGLSISKRLVTMMDGRIWLESVVGQGTTFHFTANFLMAKSAAPLSADTLWLRSQSLRALIIEDHEVDRNYLRNALDGRSISSVFAGNAGEALQLLDQQPFDLVLIDTQIPGLPVRKFAQTIRHQWPGRDTRIILLSLIGETGTEGSRDLVIDGNLAKPFKAADLTRTLRQVLDVHSTSKIQVALAPTPAAPEGRDASAAQSSLQILLVEDNHVNQVLARRLLERDGHQVSVASNGLQALDYFQRQPFDLILMDVQMPEMDGYETTRRIRAIEGHDVKTTVVALTAHAMKEDADRCREAGMNGFLTKPIRAAEIASLVGEIKNRISQAEALS